jgi:hypothetical protein
VNAAAINPAAHTQLLIAQISSLLCKLAPAADWRQQDEPEMKTVMLKLSTSGCFLAIF